METNFKYIASSRSTEELIERVENRQKYLPETTEASVTELQYRKHEFTDEELKIIGEDIQAQRENASIVTSQLGFFNKEYKNVIIEDTDAPLLYSRIAIYSFSFLFGAPFGSIMMAMNLAKLGKSKESLWAILFGIGFTTLQYIVISHINTGSTSSLQVFCGFIAAYCLDLFFWKNYIGYSTFYRKRPIWVPLIIALVFVSLILAAIILGPKQ
jgi:hypothetical protein